MSKKILTDAIIGEGRFASRREAENAIDTVTSAITKLAVAGERVHIRGFGGFQIKQRKGRQVRLNGVMQEIPARDVLTFTDRRGD